MEDTYTIKDNDDEEEEDIIDCYHNYYWTNRFPSQQIRSLIYITI